MRHLIHTDDISDSEINSILSQAFEYKKGNISKTLQDKKVITTFFENSTRTLSSFEIAVKNLGGAMSKSSAPNLGRRAISLLATREFLISPMIPIFFPFKLPKF